MADGVGGEESGAFPRSGCSLASARASAAPQVQQEGRCCAACPGGITEKGPLLSVFRVSAWTPRAEASIPRHPQGTCVWGLSPTFSGGGLAFWFGAWICLLALAGGTVDPCLRHTSGTCPETAPSCPQGYPSSWQRARHWHSVPEVAREGQFCPFLSLGLP